MRFIGCLFIFCCIFFFTLAQQPENKGIEEVAIELPVLPPLSVLIDSALARSPQKQLLELEKLENEINLSLVKREWLHNIGIVSGYKYGKDGYLSTENNVSNGLPTTLLTNKKTSLYSIGIAVNYTIGDIIDRKSRIRLARIKVDKADAQLISFKNELTTMIYDEYSKLKLCLHEIKSKASILDSYRAQLLLSEKDYLNNRTSLQRLTQDREVFSKSVLELEKSKEECRKSIHYLEILTGVRFSSIN